MSVLIKGIEMPAMPETIKQGEAVPYIDVRIFADETAITSKGERPYYTQYNAVPVPPQGRLIDADALEQKINMLRIKAMTEKEDTNPYWNCLDEICQTPTVIEAEGQE